VLVDTEWDCYGGSVPRGETAAELAAGQLRCTLPAFSGFLLRVSTEAGE
jgi:hypothetical protein